MDLPPALLSFYCPIASEVSPEHEAVAQEMYAWIHAMSLTSDNRQAKMLAQAGAGFNSYFTPRARGELARALSKYNVCAWIANGMVQEIRDPGTFGAMAARWARIMEEPATCPADGIPMDFALADAFSHIRRTLSPVKWQHFSAAQSHWMHGLAWENCLHQVKGLTVHDYLSFRYVMSGCFAAAAFAYAVPERHPSAEEWAHPKVRAAADAAMMVDALDNDRYSYLKESLTEADKKTIFAALRHENPALGREEVIVRGVQLRDRILTLYLTLRGELLCDASEGLRSYLTGLDLIIAGNLVFCADMGLRYGLPEGSVRTDAEPLDRTVAPPGIGAIDHWWAQAGA
uniref:Diterpene cyclase DtcycB n=1 Tax=Streptomyces sp. TaxID=1931 RepID=DTCYB_STRSQ|nr:RecName: Full=Diterpene cyclase DtcycB; AltName: Full=Cembrene A synthase; AltName: Full=Nephthenol synthase; AltName: Full=Pentamethylcyclopentadecatrienol synthase [Streptomyces sp.]BAM78698.1 diterpene cyclase [Streptomyces sp. SANK 60404]